MTKPIPHHLFPETWTDIGCSRISKSDTPKLCGVYAYFGWTLDEYLDKEKPKLYYIGSSSFIQQRMSVHSVDKKLSHLFCIQRKFFQTDDYKYLEVALIGMYNPPMNIHHKSKWVKNG